MPPASAVSLADLIADSGPLPADAALECVQRIAERLTSAHPTCAHLEPADVLVDDDGGVWIRQSREPGRIDLDRGVSRPEGMDRLGRLLAFVATGDGAHLADGAEVDPSTLPPPLSTVAGRLFSRNGACYRSYADLARDAAHLRQVANEDSLQEEPTSPVTAIGEPVTASAPVPSVVAADESFADESLANVTAPAKRPPPEAGRSRLALAMLIVFLLALGVAFVVWQLL